MSWVCATQASTEVYRPSCALASGSRPQAVNSSGAALINSKAVVFDLFMATSS